MRKINPVLHLWSLVLVIIPFILIAIFWNALPDKIPAHWNAAGEVDRYDGKSGILLLPFVNLSIYALLWMIPFIDPKKNFGQFFNTFEKIQALLISFFFGLFLVIFGSVLGYISRVEVWIMYLTLGLLLFIGNYLGKVRPNYFLGIRTPWTLESEEVWVKTHRLAGKLWVFSMIALIIISLFISSKVFFQIFIYGVIIVALIPIVYSYFLYNHLERAKSS